MRQSNNNSIIQLITILSSRFLKIGNLSFYFCQMTTAIEFFLHLQNFNCAVKLAFVIT